MAVIYSEGLTNGQRLRLCSDTARLWFPYLFSQANNFGRLEIDYAKNVLIYGMECPPTEGRFTKLIAEYKANYLLFLYGEPRSGAIWGQWWAKEKSLPDYKRREDLASPAPPKGAFEAWQAEYAALKRQAGAEAFGELPASAGPSRAAETPQPLVVAVLEACREWFPATDEAMARQIVMVALAVRPGWKVSEVGPTMKAARWKAQEGAAGYLKTLPNVLKALAAKESQLSLFVASQFPETHAVSTLSDEEIAARDRERLSRKLA